MNITLGKEFFTLHRPVILNVKLAKSLFEKYLKRASKVRMLKNEKERKWMEEEIEKLKIYQV